MRVYAREARCVSIEGMWSMRQYDAVWARRIDPIPDGPQHLRTHPLLCPTHTTYQMHARYWVIS